MSGENKDRRLALINSDLSDLGEHERDDALAIQTAAAMGRAFEPLQQAAEKLRLMAFKADGKHPVPLSPQLSRVMEPRRMDIVRISEFLREPGSINTVIALTGVGCLPAEEMIKVAQSLLEGDRASTKRPDSRNVGRVMTLLSNIFGGSSDKGQKTKEQDILNTLGPLAEIPQIQAILSMLEWYARVVVDTDYYFRATLDLLKEHQTRMGVAGDATEALERARNDAELTREQTNTEIARLLASGARINVMRTDDAERESLTSESLSEVFKLTEENWAINDRATIEAIAKTYDLQRRQDSLPAFHDLRRTLLLRAINTFQSMQSGIRGMDLTIHALARILSSSMRTREALLARGLDNMVRQDMGALRETVDQIDRALALNIELYDQVLEMGGVPGEIGEAKNGQPLKGTEIIEN